MKNTLPHLNLTWRKYSANLFLKYGFLIVFYLATKGRMSEAVQREMKMWIEGKGAMMGKAGGNR